MAFSVWEQEIQLTPWSEKDNFPTWFDHPVESFSYTENIY